MHNKEVITEKKTKAAKCNCIKKPDCPLSNQCQITKILYKARITSKNYHEKVYYGTSEGTTIRIHLTMKNIGEIQSFQRNTGDLKNSKQNLKYLKYLKKMSPNKKNMHLLFMFEREIIYH